MKILFKLMLITTIFIGLSACEETAENDAIKAVPANIEGLTDISIRADEAVPDLYEGVILSHSYYDETTITLTIEDDVIWDEEGVYYLTYIAETPFGMITRATRLVTILPARDVTVDVYPIFTGLRSLTYVIGEPLPDILEGISALDVTDGYLSIILDDSAVNYDVEGTYTITLEATNSRFLTTTETIEINVVKPTQSLNIVYVNDVHGAILETDTAVGFDMLAGYLETLDPSNTLFISGGDILQGNIISNYFYGASVIEALNAMNHDAFVVGNHEFDWGIEEVTKFFIDGASEVQATFPLLAANIFFKGTHTRPEGMDPYAVIEKAGLTIGIIGTIGYGLESSIAVSRVQDYEFTDPIAAVEMYATYLRQNEGVDMVIAINHGNSSYTNSGIAALTGDARVDILFNGHSHSVYTNSISRDGLDMPVIQSGGYGSHVGLIDVTFDETGLTAIDAVNVSNSSALMQQSSVEVSSVIQGYYDQIQALLEDEIIKSSQAYSSYQLTYYMATLMALKTDAVMGIHNAGGTRTDIAYNESLTIAKIYEIFPFDNVIKTVELLGSTVLDLQYTFGSSEVYLDPNITIDPETYYKVATNDYVFDKTYYPFINGINIYDTSIMIRDILIDELYAQAEVQDTFSINQIISLSLGSMVDVMIIERRQHDGSFI